MGEKVRVILGSIRMNYRDLKIATVDDALQS